ncbi:MAG: zinc-binding alcohol dehydrogenase family protein [Rhizobiales bacterium]|nr:zinc-binding alcohol dehydrogenase family protein [Hyphomicrobiales bacterium]
MRTIVCVEPGRLERREAPLPEDVPGLVAVDIRAVGICGTDFHIFEGTHPFLAYPRVMGHELSGVVAGGAASPDLAPGTQVVINPYLSCGHCVACRKGKPNCCATLKVLGVHVDGGMCERILVPEGNLYPANDLSLRDAAMIEFQAIGAHAVRRSEVKKGDRVLVVGAGPIGVGTGIFARLAGGAVTLMDISQTRLDVLADRFGFGAGIRAGAEALAEIERQTGGDRYDVVFDATGNARAMEGSFAYVASGGTLVFVGVRNADITFSDPEFHRKEMTLKATRNATREDFETVMAAVRGGKVPMDALNTHSGTLDELPEAMPAWMGGPELPLKAVVTV